MKPGCQDRALLVSLLSSKNIEVTNELWAKATRSKTQPHSPQRQLCDEARGERPGLQALGAQLRRENHSGRGERKVRKGKGAFSRPPPPGMSVKGVPMVKEMEMRVQVKW